jgi:NAD(P)-dependent dehydrogenase (short-subunit alcohol dehydrogenase family)
MRLSHIVDTIRFMESKLTAIVTGAGRGIGRATAIELARAGYALALLARTEADLAETARLTGASDCLVLPSDVSQSAPVEAAVARTLERFGRVDAVVNCAGYAPLLPLEETADDIWEQTIATNLSSAFYLCRAAWPIFKRQSAGAVVLVSSMAARDPFPGFSAYGAAKAGVNSLGVTLSREGAKIGVRVHVVAPGETETTMLRSLFSTAQFPAEMTLSPDDVARIVASCLGGDLINTSGEVIYVHK